MPLVNVRLERDSVIHESLDQLLVGGEVGEAHAHAGSEGAELRAWHVKQVGGIDDVGCVAAADYSSFPSPSSR